MRKKKIFLVIFVVLVLLSALFIKLRVFKDDKVVVTDPNVPFDYMMNLKRMSLGKYETLSTSDKKLVYSIPEDVAKILTTEALLETILNNEYLVDLFAFDDFIGAVISREVQFRIVEFLNRENSIEVLNVYIEKYEEKISEEYSSDINRQLRFMENLKDNYSEILRFAEIYLNS